MAMKKEIENFLKKNRVFSNKKANKHGISNRMITYYKKKGILHKYSKGIYISNYPGSPVLDPTIEELMAILHRIPEAVVCLISALYFYELTDEMPRKFWLAIPHEKWALKIKNTRIIRTRKFKEGKTKIKIAGVEIPIYDRERTIIDCFKYLDLEVAIKALKMYLKGNSNFKPDIQKLRFYAKMFRKDISEYITSIMT
jgi:predicted transcriptional regulator of viral defense system